MNCVRTVKYSGCRMKRGMDGLLFIMFFRVLSFTITICISDIAAKTRLLQKNMIEINHCLTGRFECSFGENSCCYMAGRATCLSVL